MLTCDAKTRLQTVASRAAVEGGEPWKEDNGATRYPPWANPNETSRLLAFSRLSHFPIDRMSPWYDVQDDTLRHGLTMHGSLPCFKYAVERKRERHTRTLRLHNPPSLRLALNVSSRCDNPDDGVMSRVYPCLKARETIADHPTRKHEQIPRHKL